jgi:hypothetical protein
MYRLHGAAAKNVTVIVAFFAATLAQISQCMTFSLEISIYKNHSTISATP